jgi:AAA domain/Bifunctional DNA primase/polymerase, N-terminal
MSIAPSRGKRESQFTWPRVTGVTPLRGTGGICAEVACWVAENQGFTVLAMKPFMVTRGKKKPDEKWKYLEYRSPEEILAATDWDGDKLFHRRGVGVLSGKSGLVVVDIDNEKSWSELCDGREVPETLELQTHSGRQLIFDDGGKFYKTQAGEIALGIDVRGRGGIFVVYDPGQPERHYTHIIEPAPLPEWLIKIIPAAGAPPRTARETAGALRKAIEEGIPPGQHDSRLNALALSLVNQGWTSADRQLWLDHASGILARSGEGTDEHGRAREKFSRERIMGWFDSALDKVAGEGTTAGTVESLSIDDVVMEKIEWLNEPFLPFGCIVIIDGDPGQGKSIMTNGMIARAAVGLPALPFGHPWKPEPIHCGLIGAEDDIAQAVKGRLLAAGYTGNRHIWTMKLGRDENGELELLTFPEGTSKVHKFIADNGLRLLVVDPISAFIGEKIQTHSEASVRRALAPLVEIAKETGCCIVLVRHLNKDGSMKALYRGTGSIAFSAIARSGLITGVCPDDGSFGIAHVKCSYAERFEGVVRYSIGNADVDGTSFGTIEWGDIDTSLTADEIAKGPSKKPGPLSSLQDDIVDILQPMFDEKDTWPGAECMEKLRAAGIQASKPTIRKARERIGINADIVLDPETKRVIRWDWTTKKVSVSGN